MPRGGLGGGGGPPAGAGGGAGAGAPGLGLTAPARDYVERMLARVPGMKALLVDAETAGAVAAVASQTEVLQRDAYLVERLGAAGGGGADLMHMKACCLLRPSAANLRALREHLRDPRFGEYHLFFTNVTSDGYLLELAEADGRGVVKQVHEYYMDFRLVGATHFEAPPAGGDHLSCLLPEALWSDAGAARAASDRCVESLAAALLALRKGAPQVRFQRGSGAAERVARDLHAMAHRAEAGLFATQRQRGAPPLVLVLDRKDDPVSPLLSQWTYQAMVHELLGLENGRVDLRGRAGAAKGQEQVVLSERQDAFFREHMYENYGDLGLAIKAMVDDFQTATKGNRNLQSIEDMQRFVESYPEFRQRQGNVSKHVALMSELSRAVEERALMGVSELEQELACGNLGCSQACEEVLEAMGRPRVRHEERLRLVMLFALRYESSGAEADLARLVRRLAELGVSAERQGLVKTIVQHAGEEQRAGDLYSSRNFASRFAGAVKKGLKGVDNVYTQHQPLLATTLEAAARGKLPEAAYPSVAVGGAGGAGGGGGGGAGGARDVVAFIVGGTTFEEARAVHLLNSSGEVPGNFLLGGTRVLNSKAYLEDLLDLQRAYRRQR